MFKRTSNAFFIFAGVVLIIAFFSFFYEEERLDYGCDSNGPVSINNLRTGSQADSSESFGDSSAESSQPTLSIKSNEFEEKVDGLRTYLKKQGDITFSNVSTCKATFTLEVEDAKVDSIKKKMKDYGEIIDDSFTSVELGSEIDSLTSSIKRDEASVEKLELTLKTSKDENTKLQIEQRISTLEDSIASKKDQLKSMESETKSTSLYISAQRSINFEDGFYHNVKYKVLKLSYSFVAFLIFAIPLFILRTLLTKKRKGKGVPPKSNKPTPTRPIKSRPSNTKSATARPSQSNLNQDRVKTNKTKSSGPARKPSSKPDERPEGKKKK
jgi:hypothetical protein